MNTPTHVIINALVLGRDAKVGWLPITLGALMPDLPMVLFYLYQSVGRGISEREIWSEHYFEPGWQAFFDVFNSFPLIGLAALLAWRLRRPTALAFLASMALHCVFDLPLHREDAHAHFFPLTDWHFVSPVSYWHPEHHGRVVLGAELAIIAVGGLWLGRRSIAWRWVSITTALVTVAFAAFALTRWSSAL